SIKMSMPAFADSQVSGSKKNEPEHRGCTGPLPFAEAGKVLDLLVLANLCGENGHCGAASGVEVEGADGDIRRNGQAAEGGEAVKGRRVCKGLNQRRVVRDVLEKGRDVGESELGAGSGGCDGATHAGVAQDDAVRGDGQGKSRAGLGEDLNHNVLTLNEVSCA